MVMLAGHLIEGAITATALLQPLLMASRVESLAVAHLDHAYRLLVLRLHKGADSRRLAVPADTILKDALEIGSSRLLIAHNHPSGCERPSANDIRATRDLARTVRRANIRLVDHLVVSQDRVVSFRALDLI